jgi:hypothetical protein
MREIIKECFHAGDNKGRLREAFKIINSELTINKGIIGVSSLGQFGIK